MSGAVRFAAGGGAPPASDELLIVEPGGDAWYLTGMPWPAQPPFDEIGAYRCELGAATAATLLELARAALAAPPAPAGRADAGWESVRVGDASADWSPRGRPAPADPLVDAARAAITLTREHPWAVVRGAVAAADGALRVRLENRGEHPLAVRAGELRAGWGSRELSPSPLSLAARPAVAFELPAELAPGTSLDVELAAPESRERHAADAAYVLMRLEWRPPAAERGEWREGWLTAGPA